MTIHALWNGFITADAAAQSGLFTLIDFVAFRSSSSHLLRVPGLPLGRAADDLARARRGGPRRPPPHRTRRHPLELLEAQPPPLARAGIPRASYVRTATTLAFRKNQERRVTGSRRTFYTREVERLRKELALVRSRAVA
jgi:hypothetical protein